MSNIQIRNYRTGEIIYAGKFDSARDCVEAAVTENIALDYADLRYANLAFASLDDARMKEARLDFTNLTGANMSDAVLDGSSFTNATLHGTCLCYSSLTGCDFSKALFGATDIAGSMADRSRFSTKSAFTLNFIDAKSMKGCCYRQETTGNSYDFSSPPVYLHGLPVFTVYIGNFLKLGSTVRPYTDWMGALNDNEPPSTSIDGQLYAYLKKYRPLISSMRQC